MACLPVYIRLSIAKVEYSCGFMAAAGCLVGLMSTIHSCVRLQTALNAAPGTIAAVSPLLGLFGTVVGMIEIFGSSSPTGQSNPTQLAHGISIALYNTAFGLVVAIPSMIFYRHFRSQVDNLLLEMEMQGTKLVEILHGERQA